MCELPISKDHHGGKTPRCSTEGWDKPHLTSETHEPPQDPLLGRNCLF